MSRTAKLLLGLAGLAVVALLAWLLSHLQHRKLERDVGYHGEARTNPYVACERMMRDLGLPARRESSSVALPPDDGVLFLCTAGGKETERAAQRIVEWVERGGNLIVMLRVRGSLGAELAHKIQRGSLEFPLASAFGVNCRAAPREPAKDDEDEMGALADFLDDEEATTTITVDAGPGEREVDVGNTVWFEDRDRTATFAAGEDDDHDRVLSFRRGAGRATWVSSDGWLTNERIGARDHAAFAWDLANLAGPRSTAWFLSGGEQPGLLTLLAQHAWMALASLGVLIVLWLWKSGARFGPMMPARSRDVRDFSEHVAASAEFLWRHDASPALLAAPRVDLKRRIQLFRPDLAELEPAALERELAAAAEIDLDQVHEALTLPGTRHPNEFTRVVRNLDKLRKNL